jgi:Na+/phosphate symporter
MKGQRYFWNVLRVVSRKLDKEVRNLEDLYNMPVSEADAPEEHLVLMISKVIHMTEKLSTCINTNDGSIIESCQRLAEEIRRHERLATAGLVEQASFMGKHMFKIVVRFPSRMERIAIMLGNILDCCRIKTSEGIHFSHKAQEEISVIFEVALDMLKKLRDTLVIHNKFLLGQIKFDRHRLEHLVEDARLANWERMEAGICPPPSASVYVEILDCFRNVNEYVAKMSESLLDIARLEPES